MTLQNHDPESCTYAKFVYRKIIEYLARVELAIVVWKTTLLPLQHRYIVRVVGIEPTTHRLKVYCSINQLSYTRIVQLIRAMATATIIIGCV